MELDDLKKDWEALSNQPVHQNNLTPKIIDQMTRKKYYSMIKKIKHPEWIGGIVCLMGAGFIVFHFGELNTILLQMVGIVAILILLVIPVISLISFSRFNLGDNLTRPYAETLRQFAFQKIRFQKFQRVNAAFSYLLLVAIIVLMSKFFNGKDITDNKYFWTFSFSFGYIFLVFVSKWVKRFYNNTLDQAEELLKELES